MDVGEFPGNGQQRTNLRSWSPGNVHCTIYQTKNNTLTDIYMIRRALVCWCVVARIWETFDSNFTWKQLVELQHARMR